MNHITLMHIYLSHAFNTILKSKQVLTIQDSSKTITHHTASPSSLLRLKGLAQARGSRLCEPPSPRRGLEKGNSSLTRDLA